MQIKGKIILVDFGCLMFSAIFAHKFTPQIPINYTITNMILANLLKIGLNAEDTIMIACDSGKSWRKTYDVNYKADRKEKREKFTDINWTEMFEQVNRLLIQLDIATNWHILKIDSLEADDWLATATKYYKDNEVVLCSFDSDMEQLLARPNVKIFSPKSKKYKFNNNPYASLAKKLDKEKTDNLNNPILNEEDYNNRYLIVSLLELPEFVENPIIETFQNLKPKESDVEEFPFFSLKNKYLNLCQDKSKIVSIEDSQKKKVKRRRKKCSKL